MNNQHVQAALSAMLACPAKKSALQAILTKIGAGPLAAELEGTAPETVNPIWAELFQALWPMLSALISGLLNPTPTPAPAIVTGR